MLRDIFLRSRPPLLYQGGVFAYSLAFVFQKLSLACSRSFGTVSGPRSIYGLYISFCFDKSDVGYEKFLIALRPLAFPAPYVIYTSIVCCESHRRAFQFGEQR